MVPFEHDARRMCKAMAHYFRACDLYGADHVITELYREVFFVRKSRYWALRRTK